MRSTSKILLALALAAIATAWRVYDLYVNGTLVELIAEEATEFSLAASSLAFWPSLFDPHGFYLAIPMRLISLLLVRGFGVVAVYPAAFKIVSLTAQSLCTLLVLTRPFSAIGPVSVRLPLCLILLFGPPFEMQASFNTTYAYLFPLLYALWALPCGEARKATARDFVMLAVVFLAGLTKPAVLALLPFFAVRLARNFRSADRMMVSRLTAGFLGLSLQAVSMLFFILRNSQTSNARYAFVGSPLWLGLKNSVLAAGFGPMNLLAFPGGILQNVSGGSLLRLSTILGIGLAAGWLLTLGHAIKQRDKVAQGALLLPLVGIPLSMALVMAFYFMLNGFQLNLVELIQAKSGILHRRHFYVVSVMAGMGVLLLAQYWLGRFRFRKYGMAAVLTTAVLTVFVGRFVHVPPHLPLNHSTPWSPNLTTREAYCIPTINFPRFLVQRNCGLLETAKLDSSGLNFFPGREHKVRWRLQGVVLERKEGAPADWRRLQLIVTDADGRERTILPFSPRAEKHQFFDLNGIEIPRTRLRLIVDGKPVSANRGAPIAAIHYLGTKL